MDENDTVAAEPADSSLLRDEVGQSEGALDGLQRELAAIDRELEELAQRNHQYEVLSQTVRSLEELEDLDATYLFWGEKGGDEQATHLQRAHDRIDKFGDEITQVENRRQAILDKMGSQNQELDHLHYDLLHAMEIEESRKNEWLIEREADEQPYRAQVMPWARGCEEDQRFRKSLGTSLAVSILLGLLISILDIPILQRDAVSQIPERIAKLVREKLPPPPEPEAVAEPDIPDEEIPDPELAEDQPVEEVAEKPLLAETEQPDTREQVKSKGILAFRDSFASRANMKTTAQLGSLARLSNAGESAVGRPQRAMVTSNAPGSSGGINLADISRDVGGGGEGIAGIQVSRVASSIGGAEGPDRPLSAGARAGRTDEEIQIVFDRYKAALYRLYNRALRQNPTLRGQLVLRLTIEPDGSVSLCQVRSSDMNAPALAEQVVARVSNFNFGAKDGIVAMTIIYPIDFLPAA